MFQSFDITDILISILVYTFSLSVHEYAHARMAYRLGDDTAYQQGRMTLSPLSHIDPFGLVAFIVAHIGWARPVPYNPARFRHNISMRKGTFLVAIAGPISNIIIALFAYVLLNVLSLVHMLSLAQGQSWGNSTIVLTLILIFNRFFSWNIVLAVFNMLPIPPLDGSKVLWSFFPRVMDAVMAHAQQVSLILWMLIIFSRGLFGRIIGFLATPIVWLIVTPVDWLFSLIAQLF